ncbi:hypothetical protein [Alphaproteobacteria bacterium endosymbiont of Tiliacea citrago]|uniref:hypothetical protein n=1 Tax=Alphaproteobacteria bacterium endosymbiont of Tiliacea citrago TaxID=3077944 RepID=UPI00313AA012
MFKLLNFVLFCSFIKMASPVGLQSFNEGRKNFSAQPNPTQLSSKQSDLTQPADPIQAHTPNLLQPISIQYQGCQDSLVQPNQSRFFLAQLEWGQLYSAQSESVQSNPSQLSLTQSDLIQNADPRQAFSYTPNLLQSTSTQYQGCQDFLVKPNWRQSFLKHLDLSQPYSVPLYWEQHYSVETESAQSKPIKLSSTQPELSQTLPVNYLDPCLEGDQRILLEQKLFFYEEQKKLLLARIQPLCDLSYKYYKVITIFNANSFGDKGNSLFVEESQKFKQVYDKIFHDAQIEHSKISSLMTQLLRQIREKQYFIQKTKQFLINIQKNDLNNQKKTDKKSFV